MSKTTLTIVAYDIPSDRRRTKVHKLLCGYGKWTQFSVFECFLTEKEWVELQHKLQRLIEPQEDCVRLYRLCAACVQHVETIGSPKPVEDTLFLV